MNLITAYNSFLRQYKSDPQAALRIRQYLMTHQDIGVEKVEDGVRDLEYHIKSIQNRKIKYINVLLDFAKWLKKNDYPNLTTTLTKDYVALTRRIELIKYLQEPHSRDEIQDELIISERTLNSDFAALENGIEVLGTILKVNFKKYDRDGRYVVDNYNYHSSCNPLFLPLNMTELFLLTNVIPERIKDNEGLKESYNAILKKIEPQLTAYAKRQMQIGDGDELGECKPYVFEYDTLKTNAFNQLVYFLKRSEKAIFVFDDNGERKEIKAKVVNLEHDYFVLADGKSQISVKYEQFIGVKDFDKVYK